jgi:hypothetical protein
VPALWLAGSDPVSARVSSPLTIQVGVQVSACSSYARIMAFTWHASPSLVWFVF